MLAWRVEIRPFVENARIATGYVAKTMCSCIYVEERDQGTCRADLSRAAASVKATVHPSSHIVETRLMLVFSDEAVFEPRYGCRLK